MVDRPYCDAWRKCRSWISVCCLCKCMLNVRAPARVAPLWTLELGKDLIALHCCVPDQITLEQACILCNWDATSEDFTVTQRNWSMSSGKVSRETVWKRVSES